MEAWDRRHQLPLHFECNDYYGYAKDAANDRAKALLALPIPKEIFRLSYELGGKRRVVRVFPTVQFLYSHHARPEYVDDEVKTLVGRGERMTADGVQRPSDHRVHRSGCCYVLQEDGTSVQTPRKSAETALVRSRSGLRRQVHDFFHAKIGDADDGTDDDDPRPGNLEALDARVEVNRVRQNPSYSLIGIRRGVYVIGTKDQLTVHDLAACATERRLCCVLREDSTWHPRRCRDPPPRNIHVAPAAVPVFTEYPRGTPRATRLHGISTWHPRRCRDPPPRNIRALSRAVRRSKNQQSHGRDWVGAGTRWAGTRATRRTSTASCSTTATRELENWTRSGPIAWSTTC